MKEIMTFRKKSKIKERQEAEKKMIETWSNVLLGMLKSNEYQLAHLSSWNQ